MQNMVFYMKVHIPVCQIKWDYLEKKKHRLTTCSSMYDFTCKPNLLEKRLSKGDVRPKYQGSGIQN
jgi:hypothetical protein